MSSALIGQEEGAWVVTTPQNVEKSGLWKKSEEQEEAVLPLKQACRLTRIVDGPFKKCLVCNSQIKIQQFP